MSAWDGLNRRKFPRINYPCLLTVRQGKGPKDVILTHTENLGSGGVCITLKKNLKLLSTIELELDLLDFGEHIKCSGKVVWSIRRKSDASRKPMFYDVGLEFAGLSDQDCKRIDAIVARLAKQQKAVR